MTIEEMRRFVASLSDQRLASLKSMANEEQTDRLEHRHQDTVLKNGYCPRTDHLGCRLMLADLSRNPARE